MATPDSGILLLELEETNFDFDYTTIRYENNEKEFLIGNGVEKFYYYKKKESCSKSSLKTNKAYCSIEIFEYYSESIIYIYFWKNHYLKDKIVGKFEIPLREFATLDKFRLTNNSLISPQLTNDLTFKVIDFSMPDEVKLDVHDWDRPKKCEHCGAWFTQKDLYFIHINSEHSGAPANIINTTIKPYIVDNEDEEKSELKDDNQDNIILEDKNEIDELKKLIKFPKIISENFLPKPYWWSSIINSFELENDVLLKRLSNHKNKKKRGNKRMKLSSWLITDFSLAFQIGTTSLSIHHIIGLWLSNNDLLSDYFTYLQNKNTFQNLNLTSFGASPADLCLLGGYDQSMTVTKFVEGVIPLTLSKSPNKKRLPISISILQNNNINNNDNNNNDNNNNEINDILNIDLTIQKLTSSFNSLHWAILSYEMEPVKLIFNFSSLKYETLLWECDIYGRNPFMFACELGNLFAVQEITKKATSSAKTSNNSMNNTNTTPNLSTLTNTNTNTDSLPLLWDNLMGTNGDNLLLKSLEQNTDDFLNQFHEYTTFLSDSPESTPVANVPTNIFAMILQRTTDNNSCLLLALKNGHDELAEWLINLVPPPLLHLLSTANSNGLNAFDLACKTNCIKSVKLLERWRDLGFGFKNNNPLLSNTLKFDGNTKLHYAIENGHIEIVKYLLDINDNNNENIKNSVDYQMLHFKNKKGETPIDIAKKKNYVDIIELLLPLMEKNELNNNDEIDSENSSENTEDDIWASDDEYEWNDDDNDDDNDNDNNNNNNNEHNNNKDDNFDNMPPVPPPLLRRQTSDILMHLETEDKKIPLKDEEILSLDEFKTRLRARAYRKRAGIGALTELIDLKKKVDIYFSHMKNIELQKLNDNDDDDGKEESKENLKEEKEGHDDKLIQDEKKENKNNNTNDENPIPTLKEYMATKKQERRLSNELLPLQLARQYSTLEESSSSDSDFEGDLPIESEDKPLENILNDQRSLLLNDIRKLNNNLFDESNNIFNDNDNDDETDYVSDPLFKELLKRVELKAPKLGRSISGPIKNNQNKLNRQTSLQSLFRKRLKPIDVPKPPVLRSLTSSTKVDSETLSSPMVNVLESTLGEFNAALSILPGNVTWKILNSDLYELSGLLNISKVDSFLLLSASKWSANKAAIEYIMDEEKIKIKAGIIKNTPNNLNQNFIKSLEETKLKDLIDNNNNNNNNKEDDDEITCPICYCDVPKNEIYTLGCEHFMCSECWQSSLKVLADEIGPRTITESKCSFCDQRLSYLDWFILADHQTRQRYERWLITSFSNLKIDLAKCPNTNCSRIAVVDDLNDTDEVLCKCGTRYCVLCGRPGHAPISCEELEVWTNTSINKTDEVSVNFLMRNYKRCPKCKIFIEKNMGCNHMTCRLNQGGCGYEFCWVCSRKYPCGGGAGCRSLGNGDWNLQVTENEDNNSPPTTTTSSSSSSSSSSTTTTKTPTASGKTEWKKDELKEWQSRYTEFSNEDKYITALNERIKKLCEAKQSFLTTSSLSKIAENWKSIDYIHNLSLTLCDILDLHKMLKYLEVRLFFLKRLLSLAKENATVKLDNDNIEEKKNDNKDENKKVDLKKISSILPFNIFNSNENKNEIDLTNVNLYENLIHRIELTQIQLHEHLRYITLLTDPSLSPNSIDYTMLRNYCKTIRGIATSLFNEMSMNDSMVGDDIYVFNFTEEAVDEDNVDWQKIMALQARQLELNL